MKRVLGGEIRGIWIVEEVVQIKAKQLLRKKKEEKNIEEQAGFLSGGRWVACPRGRVGGDAHIRSSNAKKVDFRVFLILGRGIMSSEITLYGL